MARIAKPLRFVLVPLTVLSLFIFPWPVTVAGMTVSGFLFPLAPFFIGILGDLLYYPGQGWLMATSIGAVLSVITYGVRYFVKTRIM